MKQEETCDISVLSPADTDDSYLTSPMSPSIVGFSSPPFKFDEHSGLLQMPPETSQPASPVGSVDSAVGTPDATMNNFSHARGRSASLPGLHRRYSAAISSPLAPRPASSSFEMHNTQNSSPSSSSASRRGAPFFHTEGQATPSTSVSGPSKGYEFGPVTAGQSPLYHHSPLLSPGVPWPPPLLVANRLISINLFAEGMPPFTIPVGALTSDYHSIAQAPPRLLIRIKLHLPSIDDMHGSPTLHGIHGTISFSRPWVTSATCITDVYAANVHHSHDVAPLQPPSVDPSMSEPTTSLPESELTRCRWLDSSTCMFHLVLAFASCTTTWSLAKQTSIYQRIIMDNDTMAVIVYDLDRSISDDSPFAEVVGFQKYRVNAEKSTYGPSAVSSSPPYSDYSQAHCPIRSRHATQTSLACALTPIGSSPMTEPRNPPAYTPKPAL